MEFNICVILITFGHDCSLTHNTYFQSVVYLLFSRRLVSNKLSVYIFYQFTNNYWWSTLHPSLLVWYKLYQYWGVCKYCIFFHKHNPTNPINKILARTIQRRNLWGQNRTQCVVLSAKQRVDLTPNLVWPCVKACDSARCCWGGHVT